MENEDDIDTEALQAQIDLSMSFAQDLVSSWVKPSTKPSNNSYAKNLEAELRDIMRRPPRYVIFLKPSLLLVLTKGHVRLGVGAVIPESSAGSSRDAARLKGRLIGKGNKREREDEDELKKKGSDENDDENEESRGGAIRKKQRLDPFSGRSGLTGKKRGIKSEVNGLAANQSTSNPSQRKAVADAVNLKLGGSSDELDTLMTAVSPESPSQPKKKKKRKKRSSGTDGPSGHPVDQLWPGTSSPHSSPKTSRPEHGEQAVLSGNVYHSLPRRFLTAL